MTLVTLIVLAGVFVSAYAVDINSAQSVPIISVQSVPSLFSPAFEALHSVPLHRREMGTDALRTFTLAHHVTGLAGGHSNLVYNVTFKPGVITDRKFPSVVSMVCSGSGSGSDTGTSSVTLYMSSPADVSAVLTDSPQFVVTSYSYPTCDKFNMYHRVVSSTSSGSQITFFVVNASFTSLFETLRLDFSHKPDDPVARREKYESPLKGDFVKTFNIFKDSDKIDLSCVNCGVKTSLAVTLSLDYCILCTAPFCKVAASLKGTITPTITLNLMLQGSAPTNLKGPMPFVSEILAQLNTQMTVGFAALGITPVFGLGYSLDISTTPGATFSVTTGVDIPVNVDFGITGTCQKGMTSTCDTTFSIKESAPTVKVITPKGAGSATASATLALSPSIGMTFISLFTIQGSVSPKVTAAVTASSTGTSSLRLSSGVDGAIVAKLAGGVKTVVDTVNEILTTPINTSYSWPFTVYEQKQIYEQTLSVSTLVQGDIKLVGVTSIDSSDRTSFKTVVAGFCGNNCGANSDTACSAADVTLITAAARRGDATVSFQIQAASSSSGDAISTALRNTNNATLLNALKNAGGGLSSVTDTVSTFETKSNFGIIPVSTTPTSTTPTPSPSSPPIALIVGAGAGGLLLFLLIGCVVVCCIYKGQTATVAAVHPQIIVVEPKQPG